MNTYSLLPRLLITCYEAILLQESRQPIFCFLFAAKYPEAVSLIGFSYKLLELSLNLLLICQHNRHFYIVINEFLQYASGQTCSQLKKIIRQGLRLDQQEISVTGYCFAI